MAADILYSSFTAKNTRFLFALPLLILGIRGYAIGETGTTNANTEEQPEAVTADGASSSQLMKNVDAVLARSYSGMDTAALMTQIQQRLQWSEKDERLIEAQGILHWDRGEFYLALPCFKRLSNPGPLAMGLMGECLLKKDQPYEAASWFLKSAQAYAKGDKAALPMYRRYIAIKPDQEKAEMEFASRLEMHQEFAEALAIYTKYEIKLTKDPASALRMGAMLSSQGKENKAIALYQLSLEANPKSQALWKKKAQTQELVNQRLGAAESWAQIWKLEPTDTTSRNRAIAHLEATHPESDSLLKSILEESLEKNPNSAAFHFKLAVMNLNANQKDMAFTYLEKALKLSPNNSTYLAKISEAIEDDDQIKAYFPTLKAQSEKAGASARLFLQVARGFSLTGDKVKACKAWSQARDLAPESLEGRRDAFLDLAQCTDPASQTLAYQLGEKIISKGTDKEALQSMSQVAMRNKSFAQAATITDQLLSAFPEEAPAALAIAKTLLAANENSHAKTLLTALVQKSPIPEASFLLGKILVSQKDFEKGAEQLALASTVYPEAQKLRAECLVELKDFQGAATEYENHYTRTGDKESLKAQARLSQKSGNAQQERLALETMATTSLVGEDEKLRLGLLQAAQGDTAKAVASFSSLFQTKKSIPEDSLWAQAALILGTRLAREGNCDRALKLLSMGIKSASPSLPNRAEVWMQIGDCHIEKSQWKEAYQAYGQGMSADPYSRDMARGRLQAAKKLSDKTELANSYQAIFGLDPDDEDANSFLGSIRQAERDYKQAVVHYRKLADLRPTDGKIWENLGNALAMVPDLEAAAIPLQTAIDLGAESDEVYINRARAFRTEGSKDMASSILEFLISRNSDCYLAILWSAKFAEEDGEP